MVLYLGTVLRWWRNWQTRRIKDPVGNFLGAGSSPAHRTNIYSAKAEFFYFLKLCTDPPLVIQKVILQ